MISKNDCALLLSKLKDEGVDTKESLMKLFSSKDVPIDVIKFINDHRQLDLTNFYNKLRKSYNNKKSNLYINIVKEVEEPAKVLTTLASLNLQILLFSKNVDNYNMFLRHSRAKEISLVLAKYYSEYDLTSCIKLLQLIRADLKACEYISE